VEVRAAADRVHAVVFDLFRTLVDPEGVNPDAFRRTERLSTNLGIPGPQFLEWWRASRDQRIKHRVPSLASLISDYCRSIGSYRSPDQIEVALSEADMFHDDALLHPRAEVVRILESLRRQGVRIGILSNTDEHEIRLWESSPLASLADALGLSVDIGYAKPEPAAYQWILDALGMTEPSRAIFIGDGESHELRGAKQAGFGSVIFLREFVANTGFQTPDTLREIALEADVTLDHLTDLLSMFQEADSSKRDAMNVQQDPRRFSRNPEG
jgi:putative hydrolase of the HAD superfamily